MYSEVPKAKQTFEFFLICVRLSNVLLPINAVRLDERTNQPNLCLGWRGNRSADFPKRESEVFMTDINIAAMSREQLRDYVKNHPQDQAAFQAYMDRLQDEPGIEITSMDQFEPLVREKVRQSQAE
jgi:hypothetical protein